MTFQIISLSFVCISILMMATRLKAHGPKRYITEKDIVRRGALSCIASPSEVEGPYYVSGMPYRSNITEGRPGLPLTLTITVLDLATCLPTSNNLTLELWHCDHLGIYSHYEEASKSYSNPKTDTNTYFRGKTLMNQTTGIAVFETIYPGWYWKRCSLSCESLVEQFPSVDFTIFIQ